LQDTIVIQESDIQDYGTGSIRYQKPGQQYTLQSLARLALNQSDNTAAHVLNIRLGEDNIQAYAYQIGMGSTNMIDNDTSARDIGKFFQMLYQNKITSKALTSEMLEYLENTEFEDRIVPLLPKNVHVYHKTGDGVNFIHDGGIISNGKTPFILVVMSSNITDEKLTKATISKIAQIVFLGRGQK
jgi:beta-lactamase class A